VIINRSTELLWGGSLVLNFHALNPLPLKGEEIDIGKIR